MPMQTRLVKIQLKNYYHMVTKMNKQGESLSYKISKTNKIPI